MKLILVSFFLSLEKALYITKTELFMFFLQKKNTFQLAQKDKI